MIGVSHLALGAGLAACLAGIGGFAYDTRVGVAQAKAAQKRAADATANGGGLAELLAPPPALPNVQRDSAGQMTGADAQIIMTALYDVAGQIRAAFIELQAEVHLALGGSDAQGR